MILEEDLVFWNKKFENQTELFDFLSDNLEQKGYVTPDYRIKLKEREKNYPTGFKFKNMNIAIPHANPDCVKTNRIIVVKLSEPLLFINAEDCEELPVELILGLVFMSGESHIDVLMKISSFLKNEQILNNIKNANSSAELFHILQKFFEKEK